MDNYTQTFSSIANNNTTTPLNIIASHGGIDGLYNVHRPMISWVNRYVTPLWYIIGFPGNILAFIVWMQPRMKNSSGCYLAALAMADFIFLILQLIFELESVWFIRVLKLPVLCESFPIFFLTSQYLSPLLVLGFTVERYISICHPFEREKFCTTTRAIKVILSLVMFSLALHAIQGYFWHYSRSNDDCNVRQEVLVGGPRSLWTIWSWCTEMLIFAAVPMAILILNIFVIKEARKLSVAEEKELCLRQGAHSSQKTSATTLMLLAVSFYLIFSTLPVTICYVLYLSFPEGRLDINDDEIARDMTWQHHLTYNAVRTIVNELGMSHYACNILIYLTTGQMFRKELKLLFLKTCCKRKLQRLRQSEFNKELRSTMNAENGANGKL